MSTGMNTPSSLNQSVWSACEIIKYLTGKDWCRLKDISQGVKMDPAKVHRLLSTLALHDFIQLDSDTHRYRLGFQFYTIAYHMSRDNLLSSAKPQIEYAASELFETINLGILTNDKSKLVYIYRIDGKLSAEYSDVPLGASCFAYESALGKCILAYLPYGERMSVLNRIEFRQHTQKSIITKEALQGELDVTRERGYAIDDEEVSPGVYCVAMPIFDSTNQIVAAMSVSMQEMPHDRKLEHTLNVLKTATTRISKALKHN